MIREPATPEAMAERRAQVLARIAELAAAYGKPAELARLARGRAQAFAARKAAQTAK